MARHLLQGVHLVVFAYTFFYYLSQSNDYQEIIHVTCVNEFIGGTFMQHAAKLYHQ
jgi:hypothetical protein